MRRTVRVIATLPGVLFAVQGLNWIFDPAAAALSLGMPLLDGIGRSTQIGDLGAFFFAMSAMILVGVVKLEPRWLRAAAMLVGGAAVVRTLAWAFHDAAFATRFIVIEVVIAALLFFSASQLQDGD
jgi:hypothetical protein